MRHSLWQADEIFRLLVERPHLLEPGLKLKAAPLPVQGGVRVPAHGVDPLGRPCLLLLEERFDAAFYDGLLGILGRVKQEAGALAVGFRRPGEPRVFLLAPALEKPARLRLEILAGAVSLRVFSIGLAQEGQGLTPILSLELPPAGVGGLALLDDRRFQEQEGVARLRQALRGIRPPLRVEGCAWPLLVSGRNGAIAALHLDGERLVLAGALQSFGLDEGPEVDAAVDLLLREQCGRLAEGAREGAPGPEEASPPGSDAVSQGA